MANQPSSRAILLALWRLPLPEVNEQRPFVRRVNAWETVDFNGWPPLMRLDLPNRRQ
jgi:hypothetical protein